MFDRTLDEAEPPHRPRRGPPPLLYVISRESPVPWLRVRRLGEADRPALLAHLARLLRSGAGALAADLLDEAVLAARCAETDLRGAAVFAAIAGNAVIALACGAPGPDGPEIVATTDPDYSHRGLDLMLATQVRDAARDRAAPAEDAACLARLLRSLGGRVTGGREAPAA